MHYDVDIPWVDAGAIYPFSQALQFGCAVRQYVKSPSAASYRNPVGGWQ